MAKTTYIEVTPGAEAAFYKYLTPQSRFIAPRITRKISLFSVKSKKGLTQRSMLPQISAAWALLSEAEKTAWTTAGAETNLNGWRFFVQDCCARIKNDLAIPRIPETLYQTWVGALRIEAPATEIKITQIHPHFYWISRAVRGKKGMREPVLITEDFSFPITLDINYKADLTATGGGAFARFYFTLWHSYQGVDLHTDFFIDLDFTSDWKHNSLVIDLAVDNSYFGCSEFGNTTFGNYGVSSSFLAFGTYKFGANYFGESELFIGLAVRYDMFIHLYNLQGDFYFDNIKVTHSGQNWARDTYCNDINQGFTLAFYQVPKHWVAVILPNGAEYNSIYYNG